MTTLTRDDWVKVCALVLHRLSPHKDVHLTQEFIASALAELEGVPSVVLEEDEDTNTLVLRCVSGAEARRIIYQREQTHQPVHVVTHPKRRS